jgi:hypothetical protein
MSMLSENVTNKDTDSYESVYYRILQYHGEGSN